MASGLVQAWRMSSEANLFLLGKLGRAELAARYAPRTRTVAGQFAHMHAVRLRWVEHAAPRLVEGVRSLAKETEPTKAQLRAALKASEAMVARFLEQCETTGTVSSWKGSPESFLGYLVAHEAHHRGLAMVALRVAGHKPAPETVYGQWDWGKRASRR